MVDISAETFAKNYIYIISQLKRGKESILRLRIKDIGRELDVKNIFDLVDKETKGKFETNYPTEHKLESIKNMDQNLLKMKNFCMLLNAL